ncbi:UPF0481 protein At3g47200 [Coffea arabica]|uniref:UPF0481 protein At3g47200 n=1 Tax=Coffea arabica TaxID=13443 RepID=A0A6P6WW64_COFAR|nr:putative UPF0481 protein At3g02645 isoform X4 [Coffea arabica]
MSRDRSHQIAIRIDQKLSDLLDTSEKPSIFKIHGQLRSENEEAYEPEVVSIGPYHHGKPKLKEMEKHKLRYFKEILRRRGESAEKYIIALADLQDQARRCYAEEINLSNDDFVEMLCLDGCFVIEFLRKCRHPGSHWQNDPLFQMLWLRTATVNDLILFENQLPFFVLQKLFDMTKSPRGEGNLIDLAIHLCLVGNLPNPDSSVFVKSAGELRQSGIKFEKAEDDCLIDSPSDVEALRRHDTIVNQLGSDEALSIMFNKLSNHVHVGGRFCYTKIFDDVDKYTRRRWHIWRAHLLSKYFNNPWAFISFLAACALLLLTSVQAIFSILQYTSA